MRHYSSEFIISYNIILAPMASQHFQTYSPHLDGTSICIVSTSATFYSFGSDDVAFSYDANNGETNAVTVHRHSEEIITALALHPKINHSFAVGTSNGLVRYLRPIHQLHLERAEVIYRCQKAIKAISFHHSGKYLLIASEDEHIVLYSLKDKRMLPLQQIHDGGGIGCFFAGNDHLCSLGMQGNFILYSMEQKDVDQQESQSEDPFVEQTLMPSINFIDKYKITSQSLLKKYQFMNATYTVFQGETAERLIFCSGQNFLQVIELTQGMGNYHIQKGICQKEEILLVEVVTTGGQKFCKSIITSTANSLSIWNYQRKQKIISFNTTDIFGGTVNNIRIVNGTQGPSFLLTSNNPFHQCKIFHFTTSSLLLEQMQGDAWKEKKGKKKFVSRWQSYAVKLLPEYAQFILEKCYEEYQGARFLFYNNIGCIIQRIQGDNTILELELHDKSKPKRLSLQTKNRVFCYFSLREDVLAYANSTLVVFQVEKYLKLDFNIWQFRWNNIQAISIGAGWLAVSSNDQIKILDYSGNQLHTICFDRRLVTMESYEDLLAVVYHESAPMWGCQIMKVRLYRVGVDCLKREKDILMPLKPNSHVKWFGFSQQGMIYCQDTLQVLRGYLYDRDEWIPVYSLDKTTHKLFIQHISGIQIFGFRLQQKQGENIEPRVLPRTLPRRIQMDLPSLPFQLYAKQQQDLLKKMKLKNMQIMHEEYRYNRWYKLKYSRNKYHIWIDYSRSILSAEQIKKQKTTFDLKLMDSLKKMLKRCEQIPQREKQMMKKTLLLIVESEAHFEETKHAARQLLFKSKSSQHMDWEDGIMNFQRRIPSIKKAGKVNLVERMLHVMNSA